MASSSSSKCRRKKRERAALWVLLAIHPNTLQTDSQNFCRHCAQKNGPFLLLSVTSHAGKKLKDEKGAHRERKLEQNTLSGQQAEKLRMSCTCKVYLKINVWLTQDFKFL
jgi:hypothetical protein